MIPKKIHYCWFGRNPLPDMALKCIASWKKFLPDYEIIEWNEDNFDVNSIPYTAKAYQERKYAFVSDYARFKILYEHGGIYFDTDVEVIKPMDDIIENGPFFGIEKLVIPRNRKSEISVKVAPGLGLGVVPNSEVYGTLIEMYDKMSFDLADGTVVDHTTEVMKRYGFVESNHKQTIAGITIYPSDFFCPIDPTTGVMEITENTVSIHHYMASWVPWHKKFKKFVKRLVGPKATKWFIVRKRQLLGAFK